MTCFHPLWVYRHNGDLHEESGKPRIHFHPSFCYEESSGIEADRAKELALAVLQNRYGPSVELFAIPCRTCIGCRINHSKQWAIRCMHEASLHQNNCFITLTYDNDHLPKDGSLIKEHFVLFMKRLRFKFGSNIRFYMCGEYGTQLLRPHYHALLFNFDFPDKRLFRSGKKSALFLSPSLEKLWDKGFSTIGGVTYQSSAYVARYIMKKCPHKRDSQEFKNHYSGREPEYTNMSRCPGIAKDWFDKFHPDVYPDDFVVMDGKKMPAPKYYDRQLDILNPEMLERIKALRQDYAYENRANSTANRLAVREKCLKARIATLKRHFEE